MGDASAGRETKTWLITGAARGFGREFARAAAGRGDDVAATARDVSALRGRGHIVQISSIGGVLAVPNMGAYHASKWALEALSESLAAEVARFGVHVTLVEPGGYGTDWAGSSSRHSDLLPAYDAMREETAARRSTSVPGDPAAAARALLDVVDADPPPRRVLFGALFGVPTPGIV